jgi:hypothetical protein
MCYSSAATSRPSPLRHPVEELRDEHIQLSIWAAGLSELLWQLTKATLLSSGLKGHIQCLGSRNSQKYFLHQRSLKL